MPEITFVESNGTRHVLDVAVGQSLMEAAINKNVPGIEGDCGGLCACATCHVYIEPDWQVHCEAAEELETDILDFGFDVNEQSRLGCQIKVDDSHHGMVVKLPKRQY